MKRVDHKRKRTVTGMSLDHSESGYQTQTAVKQASKQAKEQTKNYQLNVKVEITDTHRMGEEGTPPPLVQ